MRNKLLAGGAVAIACASFFPVLAHASAFDPQLHGDVLFEIENDWVHKADDPDAKVNTLYTSIEPYITLSLTKEMSVEASLVFEPVQDTDPGDDTVFENEGLYAEELKFVYTGENYSVFAGKYNPSFGTAWDVAPGVFGVDMAEEYQLTERVGFGASYTLADQGWGAHTITANSFFLDTSALSDSWITRRGNTDEDDGGLSNTQDLSSYSFTLDSQNVAGVEGLSTHVGYRNQSEGDADADLQNESGYALGANYTFKADENAEVFVMGEWASLRHADGGADDVDYFTGGAQLSLYDHWNTSISFTRKYTQAAAAADAVDAQYQVSAGYSFDNGIGFDLGYKMQDADGDATHTLGALVSYEYEF